MYLMKPVASQYKMVKFGKHAEKSTATQWELIFKI